MDKLITVLTATYNRANLLPDLYKSLQEQTCKNFDWVIIDDGSSDGTKELVKEWIKKTIDFEIRYFYVENGGKNRAINYGVKQICTPYTMIVDSDDYLPYDSLEYLSNKSKEIKDNKKLAGVAGLIGKEDGSPLKRPEFYGLPYIITDNLNRRKFGLDSDASEVYKTSLLLSHPFNVWQGEKFVPEEIVWDRMAIEGYSLKWFNKVTYIARYQDSGLTKDSLNLIKQNPMGYAMLFKHRQQLNHNVKNKFYMCIQCIAYSILGGNITYALRNNPLGIILFPIGLLLVIRRKIQYNKSK